MNRSNQLAYVDSALKAIESRELTVKIALQDLFPEGSTVYVRLRDNCKLSKMTVLCCNGRGYVRAYRDNRTKRFVRDFFYKHCQSI